MDIDTFNKMRAEYEDVISTKGQGLLESVFLDAFQGVPGLSEIRWCQFTPGFNDGDACTFGIGEVEYVIEGKLNEDYENDEGQGEPDSYTHGEAWPSSYELQTEPYYETVQKFQKNFYSLERVLEVTLGDPCQVTAKYDGENVIFEVEEYECGY